MSQISPPVRILLVGAIVFLAAWFTVLRPKSATTAPPAPTPAATATPTGTPTDGLGRAVAKARGAAATEEAASKAHNGETAPAQTGTATKSAPSTAPAQPAVAIPANVLAKLPKDVSAALKAHKTLVLGVIADGATPLRPLADDDRYVRNSLRKVNRYGGQVLVKRVAVSSLVDYAPLVGDLQVNQTPSIVVIDGKLRGTVLAGYVDGIAINQAIANARADSIQPLLADPYLRSLDKFCSSYNTSFEHWSWPTIPGKPALRSSLGRRLQLAADYRSAFAGIAAPARWGSLKRQILARIESVHATIAKQNTAILHGNQAAYLAAGNRSDFAGGPKLDRKLDSLGVTSCVDNRRS